LRRFRAEVIVFLGKMKEPAKYTAQLARDSTAKIQRKGGAGSSKRVRKEIIVRGRDE